ncbi:MAG: DMT family transporter [Chitinophagaceae bacterium]
MALTNKQNNIYQGIGLALITVIIWSGNYVIARGIAKQLPPVSLAFYRWGLASVCIFPFAIKKMIEQKAILLANSHYIFWTALTGVTIFNTFIYLGGHYTSAINLALIGTTSAPIFSTCMAAIFLKEKISRNRIIGMLLCIIGILFLISQGSWQKLTHFHFGKGDVLVLISAFSFAIYTILVRKRPATISPIVFLAVIFITGTLFLLPFYAYEVMHNPAVQWTHNMVYIILYLGIGNSIIAFFCWNASIGKLGAAGTALFGNLIPVFSTIEAVIFLGEEFSDVHLISGIIVISGLIIANITASASNKNG